ncbi:MAG: hypothetical protein R3C01_10545 [Planctomycetaceae bacterium]
MFRVLLDNLRRIAAALLLLIAVPCVVEVALRVQRCRQKVVHASSMTTELVQPHRQTLFEAPPHFKQTLIEEETGIEFELRLNSFGLRSNTEVTVPRPAELTRVLVLGDDAIFGAELPVTSTLPSILQEMLQQRSQLPIEVLNGSMPRGCPTLSLLQLQHRFAALQPQLIILHVDFSDLADEEAIVRYVRHDNDGHAVAAMHPSLGLKSNASRELDAEFLALQWLREGLSREWLSSLPDGQSPLGRRTDFAAWNDVDSPESQVALQQMLQSIIDLHQLANRLSAELIVTTAPSAWQLAAMLEKMDATNSSMETLSPAAAQQLANILHETCRTNGIRLIDRNLFIPPNHRPGPFLTLCSPGRYSAAGHRLTPNPLTPP